MAQAKPDRASGVEGAWSAGLSAPHKLALLLTPGQFERYIQRADFAATLLRRKLIDEKFYRRIVSEDPILSIARQAHRVGMTDWARHVYQSGETSIPVAAASKILGTNPDTGRPIPKRELGMDDADLPTLLGRAEFTTGPRPEPPKGDFKTMPDGISLHPDAISREAEAYTTPRSPHRRLPPHPGQPASTSTPSSARPPGGRSAPPAGGADRPRWRSPRWRYSLW